MYFVVPFTRAIVRADAVCGTSFSFAYKLNGDPRQWPGRNVIHVNDMDRYEHEASLPGYIDENCRWDDVRNQWYLESDDKYYAHYSYYAKKSTRRMCSSCALSGSPPQHFGPFACPGQVVREEPCTDVLCWRFIRPSCCVIKENSLDTKWLIRYRDGENVVRVNCPPNEFLRHATTDAQDEMRRQLRRQLVGRAISRATCVASGASRSASIAAESARVQVLAKALFRVGLLSHFVTNSTKYIVVKMSLLLSNMEAIKRHTAEEERVESTRAAHQRDFAEQLVTAGRALLCRLDAPPAPSDGRGWVVYADLLHKKIDNFRYLLTKLGAKVNSAIGGRMTKKRVRDADKKCAGRSVLAVVEDMRCHVKNMINYTASADMVNVADHYNHAIDLVEIVRVAVAEVYVPPLPKRQRC
jgi:hypothetical protein